jgi:hypothetical protein
VGEVQCGKEGKEMIPTTGNCIWNAALNINRRAETDATAERIQMGQLMMT